MTSVSRLGLKTAGLTTGVLLIVFGIYWGVRLTFFKSDSPPKLAQEEARTGLPYTPPADADGDGLPDKYEEMYKTDANKADTDGDGVSDREEIEQGRDPTIPGPDDVVKPATGSQVAGSQTFTAQYLATLPTTAAREEILDRTRLEAFVETHRGDLLPALPAETVIRTSDVGAEPVRVYLDMISAAHNKQLHNVSNEAIEAAFGAMLQLNTEPLNTIVTQLEQNVKVLKIIPAPDEVADMHAKLLRASSALQANVTALRDIDQDFVGGLIATKSIDDLGVIFQEIATSVQELETKYKLE